MSGFEKPNYTQAPNAFFDKLLPHIDTVTELKVTLAVMRKTMGWGKDEDELSLTQLQELTGLRREGVVEGIKRGLKRGTISRRKVGNSFAYRLKVVGKPDQQADADSRQTGPEPSRQTGPTKEREKESNDKESSNESSLSAAAPPAPKAIKPGQFAFARFRDIEKEAKAKGWKPDPLPESRVKEYAEFYARAFEDGSEAERLDLSVWWLFAKASGQIEHEPQAWAYFGTATRAINAGWRPKASLRAVPNPEHQRIREENQAMLAELVGDVS